jgi:hypothetical protein
VNGADVTAARALADSLRPLLEGARSDVELLTTLARELRRAVLASAGSVPTRSRRHRLLTVADRLPAGIRTTLVDLRLCAGLGIGECSDLLQLPIATTRVLWRQVKGELFAALRRRARLLP